MARVEYARHLLLDALLELHRLGVCLLHPTFVLERIVEPSIELRFWRKGFIEKRVKSRQSLVVDGSDEDSIARRESRDDVVCEILLK